VWSHLLHHDAVGCTVIVGGSLRSGLRQNANVVTWIGIPPDKALFARVWAKGAAARLTPCGGLRVVARCLRAYIRGDTNPVSVVSFAPDKPYLAGVGPEHRARRVVPTARSRVVVPSLGPHIRCNADSHSVLYSLAGNGSTRSRMSSISLRGALTLVEIGHMTKVCSQTSNELTERKSSAGSDSPDNLELNDNDWTKSFDLQRERTAALRGKADSGPRTTSLAARRSWGASERSGPTPHARPKRPGSSGPRTPGY
jgi:hypothetical protein